MVVLFQISQLTELVAEKHEVRREYQVSQDWYFCNNRQKHKSLKSKQFSNVWKPTV